MTTPTIPTTTITPTTHHLIHLLSAVTSPNPTHQNTSTLSLQLHAHLQHSLIPQLVQIITTHPEASIRHLSTTLLRTHQITHIRHLPQQHLFPLFETLSQSLLKEPHHPTRRAILILLDHLHPLDKHLTALLPNIFTNLYKSSNPTIRAQAFLLQPPIEALKTAFTDIAQPVQQAALTAFTRSSQHPSQPLILLLPHLLDHSTSPQPAQSVPLYEALANLLTFPDFPLPKAFLHALATFSTTTYQSAAPAVEFLVYLHENRLQPIRKLGLHVNVITSACHVLLTTQSIHLVDNHAFLAARLLDTFVDTSTFNTAYNAVTSSLSNPHAILGAFRILQSIAESCPLEITVNAEYILGILTANPPQLAKLPALDALAAVAAVLDVEEIPDDVLNRLSEACLTAVIDGLNIQSREINKAACLALEPALNLFRNTEDYHINTIVNTLTKLHPSLTVETLLAVGVLVENASEHVINTPHFQHLLTKTVKALITTTEDALTTAAGYEAAGALITVCKDTNIVNALAEHALSGLSSDEPALKQGALSFFANLVDAIGAPTVPRYAQVVMSVALESVVSKDIFVTTDHLGNFTDVDYEQVDDNASVQVRTAYLDEKMVAIGCLGAFGTAVGNDQFLDGIPSMPDNANVVLGLLTRASELVDVMTGHFHSEIRSAAYRASCRLASANVRVFASDPSIAFCSMAYTERVLSIVLEGLRDDLDLWVVTDLANTFSIFLAELPLEMIMNRKDDIIQVLSLLIAGKTSCQTQEQDEGEDDLEIRNDDLDSLIEGIGDIIEALVRKFRGHFAKHFLPLLDQVLKTLYIPTQSGRSRGMVLGTISGILLFMSWQRCPFPPPPVSDPVYQHALKASDDLATIATPLAIEAVRHGDSRILQRNAVFLLGVIYKRTTAGNADVWTRLPNVLQLLQDILARGKSGNGALVDNAAGALARILTAEDLPHHVSCNRAMMLTAALACVPMGDDPVENTTVARAVLQAAEVAFNDLVKGDLWRVLSCLVSAVLVHVETSANAKSRWISSVDPNEEMVRLNDEEFGRLVEVLIRIRQIAGEGVFGSLTLSARDAEVLSGVMKVKSKA